MVPSARVTAGERRKTTHTYTRLTLLVAKQFSFEERVVEVLGVVVVVHRAVGTGAVPVWDVLGELLRDIAHPAHELLHGARLDD